MVVGMDPNASLAGDERGLREGVLGITAVEHDAGGLGDNLRGAAYHILHTVDTGIDSNLADAGGAADDLAEFAHTFLRDLVALDDDASETSQVATLVDVANDNLRGGDDNAVVVAIEEAFAHLVE